MVKKEDEYGNEVISSTTSDQRKSWYWPKSSKMKYCVHFIFKDNKVLLLKKNFDQSLLSRNLDSSSWQDKTQRGP